MAFREPKGQESCHTRRMLLEKKGIRYHPDGTGKWAEVRSDYLSEIGGYSGFGEYEAWLVDWHVKVLPFADEEQVRFILTSPDGRKMFGRRRCVEDGLTILEWLEGQYREHGLDYLIEEYAR